MLLVPSPVPAFNSMTIFGKVLVVLVGTGLILLSGYIIFLVATYKPPPEDDSASGSGTTTPPLPSFNFASATDGKSGTIIPASTNPLAADFDYGLQFWVFIKDWDYRFGETKSVIMRRDPNNAAITNPNVSLNAAENNLDISISIFGTETTPAPSNSTGATGDNFTLSVENVPLQTWFSVSITTFQRNIDVYINGKLVKSAVLPGVARPATGDIVIGAGGGFSGSVCGVKGTDAMLGSADALTFYSMGTPCSEMISSSTTTGSDGNETTNYTLFGYTFTFGIKDASGKTVREYSGEY
jgi:hypothetical protein